MNGIDRHIKVICNLYKVMKFKVRSNGDDLIIPVKVSKNAKIRNQVPHLTQDTNGKATN